MSRKKISFKLTAYTDAAGKYSPDAFRSGNEDNFYVNYDLSNSALESMVRDEEIPLGPLGVLMVVADGMGGMNAGEVASQIAVDTVKESFRMANLSKVETSSPEARQRYLERVIKKADKNIKSDARENSAHEGMGSTIIMAWLYEESLIVSWCGDSRAYIYNDKSGIRLISQDHSYVQELVNKGLLTYEQTFDHPQNNIITRSLGDPTKDAKAESRILTIGKGDIILLCSDGLSGVLRDRKTYNEAGDCYPEENIEDIIRAHTNSMKECREALWSAAERGGWYDNVTAILCQITDGPESEWGNRAIQPVSGNGDLSKNKRKSLLWWIACVVIVAAAIIAAFLLGKNSSGEEIPSASEPKGVVKDSTDTRKGNHTTPKDSIKGTSKERSKTPSKEQKTVSIPEQIKKQNKEKKEINSDSSDGLTPIPQKENKTSRLLPSEDISKDNPLKSSKGTDSNNPIKE
jgi:protein phosphatase